MAEEALRKAHYNVKEDGSVFDEKHNYVGHIKFGILKTQPIYEIKNSDDALTQLTDKVSVNLIGSIIKSLDFISLEPAEENSKMLTLITSIPEKMDLTLAVYKDFTENNRGKLINKLARGEIETALKDFETFGEGLKEIYLEMSKKMTKKVSK